MTPGAPLPPIVAPRLVAEPADATVAGLLQACLAGAPDYFERTEGAPADPDAAARLLSEAEADDRRRLFLVRARGSGAALGVLDLWLDQPEPGTAHLGLLLLAEAWQGRGYGLEAAGALERSLALAGYDTLRLSVGDENPEARAFWDRAGFAEVGRIDRGVTVLEKPLGPATRRSWPG